MVAAVVLAVLGIEKQNSSSGTGVSVPRAAAVAARPAARNVPPATIDATTSASFKLEPYIPYHDTLKSYAYSVFAKQHQVISGVVSQTKKAVVCLSIIETFGDKTRISTIGTGLIIDPRGYVVTTADNVADHVNFQVFLFNGNHRHQFAGDLVSADPSANIALVKIRSTGSFILPFFALSDNAPVKVGDWVIANGSPDGLHVVAMQGMVSSTKRTLKRNGKYFYDLIQTGLKIEGAMMGSPVFDIQGNVVGLCIGDGLVLPISESSSPIFGMYGIR